MARILLVVASRDFRDEEVLEPRAVFEEAGAEVVVASTTVSPIRGTGGAWVVPDRLLASCRAAEFDAIVFAGGDGAAEYLESRTAHRLCREAVERDRVLGALCVAPSILANAGVLEGVRATAWPARHAHLRSRGAIIPSEGLVVHGRIVTADGPARAAVFARAVLAAMR